MTIGLRFILICISCISLIYVLYRISISKLQIEYAVFWIICSMGMILISVFPEIVYFIAQKLGMISPVNVVFIVTIGLLFLKVFMMTLELSALESKVKELVEKIAINEKNYRDEQPIRDKEQSEEK